MEKKKLLSVAISTGIFLVLTIGAAIAVFSPKNTASSSGVIASRPPAENSGAVPPSSYRPPAVNQAAAVPEQPASPAAPSQESGGSPGSEASTGSESSASAPVNPVDIVSNPGNVPGLTPPPEGTVRQEGDFYINGSDRSGNGGNTGTVITVPKPVVVAVPEPSPAKSPVSAPRPAQTQTSPKPAAPVQTASPPREAAAPASRPKPAVQTKVYDDYWVQTGAFSTVAKAEGVKESLAAKGITSLIENRQIDGKTIFRVRVGPYTSQNEANYWLSLIKSIDGFEKSLVMQTQSRR